MCRTAWICQHSSTTSQSYQTSKDHYLLISPKTSQTTTLSCHIRIHIYDQPTIQLKSSAMEYVLGVAAAAAYFGNAYFTKRRQEAAETVRRAEETEIAHRAEEAETLRRREKLESAARRQRAELDRLWKESQIKSQRELAEIKRLKEEAKIAIRKEGIEMTRLRHEAIVKLRTLEAEISRSKIESGNIRVREEAETLRCRENAGVSRFVVPRGENECEVTLARSRDDVEVFGARGEHIIKVGRGRHEVAVMNTSQAGYRTFDERQDFVDGFGPAN
jgi:hypothetical protein